MSSPRGFLALLLCTFGFINPASASAQDARAVRVPLTFEENYGQADERVNFLARSAQGLIFLTRDGVVLTAVHGDSVRTVRMKFSHMNQTNPIGETAIAGFANYYKSKDRGQWLSRIPLFSRVRYTRIYPEIDAVIHGRDGHLEYDFEVAPGGNPNQISIQFEGADKISTAVDGGMEITSGSETWRLLPPVAYQNVDERREPVSASFRLMTDHSLALDLGQFDHSLQLIIDPVVQYSNLFTVDNNTVVSAIQVDSAGDLFLTGQTLALNYPVVNGKGPISNASQQQVYLTKLNPAGDIILYSTYIPANGSSTATSLAIDGNGDAYIAGVADDPSFPVTSSNLGTCTPPVCNAGFIGKFSPTGAMLYSTLLASGQIIPKSIVVDGNGDAFVAGDALDNTLKTTPNAFQPSLSGSICSNCGNGFFAELNPEGTNYLLASYFAGPPTTGGLMQARGIALDATGNILIAGNTNMDPPLVRPWQSGLGGLFLSEFAPDGRTLLFSTRFGGTIFGPNELMTAMAIGNDGTVFMVGTTQSPDFPYSVGAPTHQVLSVLFQQNITSMFATAVDPTLTRMTYSDYLGDGLPFAIAVDSRNHLYVTGSCILNLLPLQNAVVSDVTSGGFVLELDPAGVPVTVSQFGGHFTSQIPTAVAVDSSNNVYLASGFLPQNVFFPDQPDPVVVGPQFGQDTGGNYGSFFGKINTSNSPQISFNPLAPFLSLRNAGSADLHITNISLSGGLAKKFGNCPGTIPAGSSCILTVTDPNDLTAAGTVAITSDAQPPVQTFPVTLPPGIPSGRPIGDLLFFQDVRFAYPVQFQGTATANIPMKVWNVGTSNATINSVVASGSLSQSNNCIGPLTPGASCTIQASVTAGGNQPAMRVFYDTAGEQDFFFFIVLSSQQQLNLSAQVINFGTQQVSGVAIPRIVTATNTDATSLPAPLVSIQGDPEFVLAGNTCTAALAPHQSCVVGVQFLPTTDGAPSATLTISGVQVSLLGLGQNGSIVQANPEGLEFPPVIVGKQVSNTLPVTLINTSASVVSITGVSFSLADFSEMDNCQGQVPAKGNCTMQIKFSPMQLGLRRGALSISFSGGALPQVVTLAGLGISPFTIQIATGSASTVNVKSGETATYQLSVSAAAGFTEVVQFSCSGAPKNSSCSIIPPSVDFSTTMSKDMTVTVKTGVANASAVSFTSPFLLTASLCLPCLFCFRRHRRSSTIIGILFLGLTYTGCGGGGGGGTNPPPSNVTPSGMYILTVTGTSGAQPQSVQLKLIVN
jgi:hypothetical protein